MGGWSAGARVGRHGGLRVRQGLTLLHISAQRKRFLGDRGCNQGLFKRCLGGVRGYQGVSGGISVYLWCILCQKRLRLSLKVDECKPLVCGGDLTAARRLVGRCRLTLSNPR